MAIRWWSERPKTSASALPPLPANARAAEFLPDAELLPKVAVYVTNGGYGGLHYAMENGVPIVGAGDTEDKPEGAARVAWAGAGINLKTGRPRPEAIRDAVQESPQRRPLPGREPAHRSGDCRFPWRGRAHR